MRTSTYKYLGVILTPDLSWSDHISTICAKASRSLGYLRRNLRHAPSNVRQLAYQTFVLPQLEFASSIWSPFQKYLIDMIESIQNRAARFITRNYNRHSSITQIKRQCCLQPLQTRRYIAIICLFHKYIYASTTPPFNLQRPSITSRRLFNHYSFSRIYGATHAFNSSALPSAIRLWNDLPDHIASVSCRVTFRRLVSDYYASELFADS